MRGREDEGNAKPLRICPCLRRRGSRSVALLAPTPPTAALPPSWVLAPVNSVEEPSAFCISTLSELSISTSSRCSCGRCRMAGGERRPGAKQRGGRADNRGIHKKLRARASHGQRHPVASRTPVLRQVLEAHLRPVGGLEGGRLEKLGHCCWGVGGEAEKLQRAGAPTPSSPFHRPHPIFPVVRGSNQEFIGRCKNPCMVELL